jgi:hypothetical protein
MAEGEINSPVFATGEQEDNVASPQKLASNNSNQEIVDELDQAQ